MGEIDDVRKRRTFRWPKETRDLIRAYEQRSQLQEHSESDRRLLVTRLAEISGNPRDACLRFLREFGVKQKRLYREWTKPEQQRLMDLITTMPVEEAAKNLRRSAGSVRSMLHRLGIGGQTGREWVTHFHSLGLYTPGLTKYKSGLTRVGASHVLSPLRERKPRLFMAMISASSLRSMVGLPSAALPMTHSGSSRTMCFPSHADLLSVRGTYKKQEPGEDARDNVKARSGNDSDADRDQEP